MKGPSNFCSASPKRVSSTVVKNLGANHSREKSPHATPQQQHEHKPLLQTARGQRQSNPILRAIKTHMCAKERVPGNRKHQVSASRLSSLSDHRTFRGCGKVNSHRCAVYTHVLCIIGKVYAHTNKFYKRRYGQIVSRKNNLFPLHSLVTLKMLLLIQL